MTPVLHRGVSLAIPAIFEPTGFSLVGQPLPARGSMLLLQQHDPIPSAEADWLSDAAAASYAPGGVDPLDIAAEFAAMMLAVRAAATVDYSGTYEHVHVVQTPGGQALLRQMLLEHDPVYHVDAPPIIFRHGMLIIRWRIDHAGIYTP